MYVQNVIKNGFYKNAIGLAFVSVLITSLFRYLADRATGIGNVQTFFVMGILFALGAITALIETFVGMCLQLRSEIGLTRDRHIGYIRSAYRKVRNVDPRDVGAEDQFRSFLSKLLNALNAGISCESINDILKNTLESNFYVILDIKCGNTMVDEKIVRPFGRFILMCMIEDYITKPPRPYQIASIKLF